ncbi:MAG: hypothetical protein AAF990_01945 [Bacteroidota bacterium]
MKKIFFSLGWLLLVGSPKILAQAFKISSNTAIDSYTFELQGFNNNPTYAQQSFFEIFWYFGDGTHAKQFFVNNGGNPSITHSYNSNHYTGNNILSPYAEVTVLAYEEIEPPERFLPPTGNNFINCSNCQPNVLPPSNNSSIYTNREAVPGHRITYIINPSFSCAASNNATVIFEYNSNEMFLEQVVNIDAYSTKHNANNLSSSNPLSWQYNLSDPNPRPIFIRMQMISDITEGSMVQASVKIQYDGATCQEEKFTISKMVRNSHDPNALQSDQQLVCYYAAPEDAPPKKVRYRIVFQNQGNQAADSVMIYNRIPDPFVATTETIDVVYPLSQNGEPPATNYNPRTGEFYWKLKDYFLRGNQDLRGEQENGVDISETIDSLVYVVNFKDPYKTQFFNNPATGLDERFASCDAIVNEAEIIFDSNPPILTNAFQSNISCQIDSCSNCATYYILADTSWKFAATDSFELKASDYFLPEYDYLQFRWYPSAGMSNARKRRPKVSPAKNTNYFLVLSQRDNSCERVVIQFPVFFPCNQKIFPTVFIDPATGDRTVCASVSGNLQNWKWQDGEHKSSFKETQISQTQADFYLSVLDTTTGCHQSRRVALNQGIPTSGCAAGCLSGGGATQCYILFIGSLYFLTRRRKYKS